MPKVHAIANHTPVRFGRVETGIQMKCGGDFMVSRRTRVIVLYPGQRLLVIARRRRILR